MNKKLLIAILPIMALVFASSAYAVGVSPIKSNSPRVGSTTRPDMGRATTTSPIMGKPIKEIKNQESNTERFRSTKNSERRILAAAGRIIKISNALSLVGEKLRTRVVELEAAGKDVASLKSTLDDMKAKIADAIIQAQAASSTVTSLVPDNGDNAIFKANNKILKEAHEKIKIGNKDLVVARKDASTIIKAISQKGNASTTPAVSSTTPMGSGNVLSQ